MNEPLKTLLDDVGRDLKAEPGSADRAWKTARRQSRRARIASVAAVTVAAALTVVLARTPWSDSSTTPPIDEPTPTPTSEAPNVAPIEPGLVQDRWEAVDIASLPQRDTALPDVMDLEEISAYAVPLAEDPVERAIAVVQDGQWTGFPTHRSEEELFVLADDGGWRRLTGEDLGFGGKPDPGGLLSGRSLSPDGTKLATAGRTQTSDGKTSYVIVVVDLTTGEQRRFDVPERGLFPVWTPDGTLLYSSYELDPSTGDLSPVPYNGSEVGISPLGEPVELHPSQGALHPAELRTFASDGSTTTVPIWLRIDEGYSEPEIGEKAVAFARSARRPDIPGILVADLETGEPLAQLRVPSSRLGWISPAGWLDDETLLVESYTQRVLLSWNYRTGELMRVSTYTPQLNVDYAIDLLE